MLQVVEILPDRRQGPVCLPYIVNAMAADAQVRQGDRASAATVLTEFF